MSKWWLKELANGDVVVAHEDATPMLLTVSGTGQLALKAMLRFREDGSVEEPERVSLRLVVNNSPPYRFGDDFLTLCGL